LAAARPPRAVHDGTTTAVRPAVQAVSSAANLVPTLCVGMPGGPLRGLPRGGRGREASQWARRRRRASQTAFPRRAWERGRENRPVSLLQSPFLDRWLAGTRAVGIDLSSHLEHQPRRFPPGRRDRRDEGTGCRVSQSAPELITSPPGRVPRAFQVCETHRPTYGSVEGLGACSGLDGLLGIGRRSSMRSNGSPHIF
jgi:hypothetical protein